MAGISMEITGAKTIAKAQYPTIDSLEVDGFATLVDPYEMTDIEVNGALKAMAGLTVGKLVVNGAFSAGKTLSTGKLEVEGFFEADSVETGTATIDGKAKLKTLVAKEGVEVNGLLKAGLIRSPEVEITAYTKGLSLLTGKWGSQVSEIHCRAIKAGHLDADMVVCDTAVFYDHVHIQTLVTGQAPVIKGEDVIIENTVTTPSAD